MLSLLLWNAVSKNSKGKLHISMLNLGGIDFTPVCALNLKSVCSLCFTCCDRRSALETSRWFPGECFTRATAATSGELSAHCIGHSGHYGLMNNAWLTCS